MAALEPGVGPLGSVSQNGQRYGASVSGHCLDRPHLSLRGEGATPTPSVTGSGRKCSGQVSWSLHCTIVPRGA